MTNILRAGPDREIAVKTSAVAHFYVYGTSGDDDNDGLTALTPIKTFARLNDILPDVALYAIIIHCEETVTIPDGGFIFKPNLLASKVIIDGGDSHTIIDDNGGSNWTADGSSIYTLTLSTATWGVNDFQGWWIEILDGAAVGQTRSILKNTANEIMVTHDWTVDPGNCSFRIVRPTTLFINTTPTVEAEIDVSMPQVAEVYLQRFATGGGCGITSTFGNHLNVNSIIINTLGSNLFFTFYLRTLGKLSMYAWPLDLSTLLPKPATGEQCGVTIKGDYFGLFIDTVFDQTLISFLVSQPSFGNFAKNCDFQIGYGGSFLSGLIVQFQRTNGYTISCSGGKSQVGAYIEADTCVKAVGPSNPVIIARKSFLTGTTCLLADAAKITILESTVVGTASGFGASLFNGGSVDSPIIPSITASSGDITVDGTTEFCTWAELVSSLTRETKAGYVDRYTIRESVTIASRKTVKDDIAAAATTTASVQIPAGAQVLSVSTRVTDTIPDATGVNVGTVANPTLFTTGLGVSAGSTHHGMCVPTVFDVATDLLFTMTGGVPSTATGKIRYTIEYKTVVPPLADA